MTYVSMSTNRWWRAQRHAAATATVNQTAASHQQHTTSELRRRLLITFLEVTFYYFPSLLTSTLELFACFHLDPAGDAGYHNAQDVEALKWRALINPVVTP
ncbi:hypothetical protein WJX82_010188 [Trebouxia sp. C0006]